MRQKFFYLISIISIFLFLGCPNFKIKTLTINISGKGSVEVKDEAGTILSPAENTNNYTISKGKKLFVTVIADENSTFEKWEGISVIGNKAEILMDEDKAIGVIFKSVLCTLTVTPPENGTLGVNFVGKKGSSPYIVEKGTEITVTKSPNSGYKEVSFIGAELNSSGKFIIKDNTEIKVFFTAEKFILMQLPTENGAFTIDSKTLTGPEDVAFGQEINLLATPITGYDFKNWNISVKVAGEWQNDSTKTVSPYIHKIAGDTKIGAIFTKKELTLTLLQTTGGTISVNFSGMTGSSPYSGIPYDTEITATATPTAGYSFVSWDGATVVDGKFNIKTDTTLKAIFIATSVDKCIFFVKKDTGGSVEAKINPGQAGEAIVTGTDSVAYPGYLEYNVDKDVRISLKPAPISGFAFDQWDEQGNHPVGTIIAPTTKLLIATIDKTGYKFIPKFLGGFIKVTYSAIQDGLMVATKQGGSSGTTIVRDAEEIVDYRLNDVIKLDADGTLYGSTFQKFIVGSTTITVNPHTITVTGPITISTFFTKNPAQASAVIIKNNVADSTLVVSLGGVVVPPTNTMLGYVTYNLQTGNSYELKLDGLGILVFPYWREGTTLLGVAKKINFTPTKTMHNITVASN